MVIYVLLLEADCCEANHRQIPNFSPQYDLHIFCIWINIDHIEMH
jgi:hypothetical protein